MKEKIMTEINHVLLVGSETAERLSDGIISQAAEAGLGLVLNNEKGLAALSENIADSDMERLRRVLPHGVSSAKANGILHKLAFRLQGRENTISMGKDTGRGSY